jgi:hypothetical protein
MNATSGTKTITSNGVTYSGALTFNGVGGSFQLADNLTMSLASSTTTLALTNGTFLHNNKKVTFTGNGPAGVTGALTFFDVDRTPSGSSASSTWVLGANITIAGTFKYLGNSAAVRPLIQSDIVGTPRTITAAAIDAASDFCDFMDITGAGAAAPFATGTSLGDCQGNSGITFTAPAAQTSNGTTGFSWSNAARWTSRVPLPQDDVTVSNAFSASQFAYVRHAAPREVDHVFPYRDGDGGFRPCLVSPASARGPWAARGRTIRVMSQITLRGRGSYSITWAGLTTAVMVIDAPGGTYVPNDAMIQGVAGAATGSSTSRNQRHLHGRGFLVVHWQRHFSGRPLRYPQAQR